MIKAIKYDAKDTRHHHSLGRNGRVFTSGLDFVYTGPSGRVLLSPLTSRGAIARCEIQIPADPRVLRELADALNEAADDADPLVVVRKK
jgi:hypothetical protein